MGVVDEIITTGNKTLEASNDISSIVNKAKQINIKMTDSNEMQDLLLKKETTISDLNNKYKTLHESREALTAEMSKKDTVIADLENKLKQADKKEALTVINSKDLELDETAQAFWVENYLKDKEGTLKVMEGMKAVNKAPEGGSITDALKNQKETTDVDYWESEEGQINLANLKNDSSTASFAMEVQKSITNKYLSK